MTNVEILKAIVEKAIRGGYKLPRNPVSWRIVGEDFESKPFGVELTAVHEGIDLTCILPPEMFIYTHAFAKAYWGIERICMTCGNQKSDWLYCNYHMQPDEAWKFYLCHMVLEKERLLYLKRFL